MSANKRESFELLQYSADGKDLKIRRSECKTGQTYTVDLGEETTKTGKPVRVRHTYRLVMSKYGHRLRIAIVQPAKDVSLAMDYTDTNITEMHVSELVPTAKRAQVTRLPKETPARVITVDVPGWLLPQAEVSFVWALENEVPTNDAESSNPTTRTA